MSIADAFTRLHTTVLARLGEPVSLNAVVVQAAFYDPYAQMDLGGVAAASSAPQIALSSADVPANPVGMVVVSRGQNFRVVESKPDGFGLTLLLLESA